MLLIAFQVIIGAVLLWPFVFLAVWKGIPLLLKFMNWIGWCVEKRVIAKRELEENFDVLGRPYPPGDKGLCDNCSVAFEKVFHLDSGRRLCKECYIVEFVKPWVDDADNPAAQPTVPEKG